VGKSFTSGRECEVYEEGKGRKYDESREKRNLNNENGGDTWAPVAHAVIKAS